jgi:RNA polymerase sigma-70 factor (ECF subfamily)
MIAALPEGFRDAIRMSEVEGLSQQAVAARLGLTLTAAKSRIQRGRRALKRSLMACCRFEVDRRGNVVDYEPLSDRRVCLDCD